MTLDPDSLWVKQHWPLHCRLKASFWAVGKHKMRPSLSTCSSLASAHCLFSPVSDGLMVMVLAQDQAPDVGQGWMGDWAAGRGLGSVCSSQAGLCVLCASLLFVDGWKENCEGRLMFSDVDFMVVDRQRIHIVWVDTWKQATFFLFTKDCKSVGQIGDTSTVMWVFTKLNLPFDSNHHLWALGSDWKNEILHLCYSSISCSLNTILFSWVSDEWCINLLRLKVFKIINILMAIWSFA